MKKSLQKPIKVILAAPPEPLYLAARPLLETADDIVVIGEAQDYPAVVEQVYTGQPDVILLDLSLLASASLADLAQLKKISRAARLIVMSVAGQERLTLEAFRCGARGHLGREQSSPLEIVAAIRAVSRGEAILSPQMTKWILDEMTHTWSAGADSSIS